MIEAARKTFGLWSIDVATNYYDSYAPYLYQQSLSPEVIANALSTVMHNTHGNGPVGDGSPYTLPETGGGAVLYHKV